MRQLNVKGFTLIELLAAVGIFGMIAAAATALLTASLNAHNESDSRSGLFWEGAMIMEQISNKVRRCTYLLIPNNHDQVRDILAFSGSVNKHNEYYFGDPLFPRIDADHTSDLDDDGKNGIKGKDDDGDGQVDETGTSTWRDDDEDGVYNEDPIDGEDNDGDGNIDEDPPADVNGDGAPGIKGIDDDGDGQVDEGSIYDDDEDDSLADSGNVTEIYQFDSGTSRLQVEIPFLGVNNILSERVTAFQVTYEAPERILIELALSGEDGKSVTFAEYVHIQNAFQKIGKRVR